MTNINEFIEAMKTEAMQQEFVAFVGGKKPESKAAAIRAMLAFAASKGFAATTWALDDNILAQISGGADIGDWLMGHFDRVFGYRSDL